MSIAPAATSYSLLAASDLNADRASRIVESIAHAQRLKQHTLHTVIIHVDDDPGPTRTLFTLDSGGVHFIYKIALYPGKQGAKLQLQSADTTFSIINQLA